MYSLRFSKAWVTTLAFVLALGGVPVRGAIIPATYAVPSSAAVLSQPGFTWRISQVNAPSPDQLAWSESQLAGFKGTNQADISAQGAADGPGRRLIPATAPIEFTISSTINLSTTAGGSLGQFTPDLQIPGLPTATQRNDNIAALVLTYLELPEGTTTLVVNSQGGFRLNIGGVVPTDAFGPAAATVGEFNGTRSAGNTLCPVTVTKAGLYAVRLLFEQGTGDAQLEFYSLVVSGGTTNAVLINDVANGGLRAFRSVLTQAAAPYASSLVPLPDETGVSPLPTITATLVDGPTALDISKVSMMFDGLPVTSSISRTGRLTTIAYTVPSLLKADSHHAVTLSYFDGTGLAIIPWSFTSTGAVTLSPESAVQPDSSKPGFLFNLFANATNPTSDTDATETVEWALNGRLTDGAGNPYPNNANLSATGAAAGPAPALSVSNAPAAFFIPQVINLGTGGVGEFPIDQPIPGLPATDESTDGVEAEVLAYLQLPAGLTTLGIGTPDVFHVYVGSRDYTRAVQAGRNLRPGGVSYPVYVYASQAGVYPLRISWIHATGDAGLELYSVSTNGSRVLVNDTAKGGLPAYRALATPSAPSVKYVSPRPVLRQVNRPSSDLIVRLADGDIPVDDSSVALSVDGFAVPWVTNRVGAILEVAWHPTNLFTPSEVHQATLTYSPVNGTPVIHSWDFMNLKALFLPFTLSTLSEDFEGYTAGTTFLPAVFPPNMPTNLPPEPNPQTGIPGISWSTVDFTVVEDQAVHAAGDLTDPQSNYYLGWVVAPLTTFTGIELDASQVLAGQSINGAALGGIASGHVFVAESNNRADGAPGDNSGQVQFATSRDFDLSGLANPVLSWASIYKQSQNSLGAIEYSIDQGATWRPVIYYLDGGRVGGASPDIAIQFDGTPDVVTTFRQLQSDVPQWRDAQGVLRGQNYGDGIAAAVSQDLAPYLAPRIADDGSDGKRVEAVRLPLAAHQSHVRLRLAQLGSGSWYFGIDNLGFFDVPAFGPAVPAITGISLSDGNVTITWANGGTLETSPTASGSAWVSTGNTTGTYTAPAVETQFFRVKY